ncbi:MAG TPA: hypothetical protein VLT47_09650 [Anaeromyxobacteraceae bacterium]|nr:hypothetical protein [Anaeromyxobacteraceae bacterium]
MISPRAATVRSLLILAAFAAVVVLCVTAGPAHRRYAGPPEFRSVPSHLDAYRTWVAEGVKGRILFLFDRRAFVAQDGEVPAEENYLDLALRHGIVRRVYHIVPASGWSEVQEHLRADERFHFGDGAFVFPMEEGRLVVTTLDRVPHLHERALAIVNASSWTGAELEQVGALLRERTVDSDLVQVLSPNGFVFPAGG